MDLTWFVIERPCMQNTIRINLINDTIFHKKVKI